MSNSSKTAPAAESGRSVFLRKDDFSFKLKIPFRENHGRCTSADLACSADSAALRRNPRRGLRPLHPRHLLKKVDENFSPRSAHERRELPHHTAALFSLILSQRRLAKLRHAAKDQIRPSASSLRWWQCPQWPESPPEPPAERPESPGHRDPSRRRRRRSEQPGSWC